MVVVMVVGVIQLPVVVVLPVAVVWVPLVVQLFMDHKDVRVEMDGVVFLRAVTYQPEVEVQVVQHIIGRLLLTHLIQHNVIIMLVGLVNLVVLMVIAVIIQVVVHLAIQARYAPHMEVEVKVRENGVLMASVEVVQV
tara:strand:- start:860 stop:1270 length:411 start_codon:yes stop_codon:yes gene_type:complete